MSLYEDLLQKQFLPHAYEDWAEYRNAISNYLIASTAADSTLAIFGAAAETHLRNNRIKEVYYEILHI